MNEAYVGSGRREPLVERVGLRKQWRANIARRTEEKGKVEMSQGIHLYRADRESLYEPYLEFRLRVITG